MEQRLPTIENRHMMSSIYNDPFLKHKHPLNGLLEKGLLELKNSNWNSWDKRWPESILYVRFGSWYFGFAGSGGWSHSSFTYELCNCAGWFYWFSFNFWIYDYCWSLMGKVLCFYSFDKSPSCLLTFLKARSIKFLHSGLTWLAEKRF